MLVTLLGMVIDVKPVHSPKARSSMEVTLLGMEMDVSLQPSKAHWPMEVTLLGIMVFLQPTTKVFDEVSIIALQLSRESYAIFPLSTLIEVSLQSEKAPIPMEVTLLGMVIEVNPQHR